MTSENWVGKICVYNATAAGFLFSIIFHKPGTLLPCIPAHCAINSLSAFGAERSVTLDLIAAAALTVFSVLYALWILKKELTSHT